MANVKALRERCKLSNELIEEQANRIAQNVTELVKSDAIQLSLRRRELAAESGQGDVEKIEAEISKQIKDSIVENVLNPVIKFEEECRKRNLKPSGIRRLVKKINEMFALVDASEASYDEMKQAVAMYMHSHEDLYDEINYTI